MASLRDHEWEADAKALSDALSAGAHPAGSEAIFLASVYEKQAAAGRGSPAAATALRPGELPARTITVAISTRNRGALIADTLATLLRLEYPALEVLIVDQSTNDVTRRVIEQVAGGDTRVRYHRSDTIGLPAGRNVGARLSGADVIAYTDDDCIVTAAWLQTIQAELRDPDIAAVYGRLLPYERAGRSGIEVGLKDSLERVEYAAKLPPWHVGHGGNMAFRRAALLEVGGFDPLLGAGARLCSGEDGDMTYRLLSAGKRIVYNPRALAYHKQWKDWHAQTQMERAYGIGAGAQFAKYIRCGDLYGLQLLCTWIWQLGVRRVGSGLLKWHSWKVMYLGYCQLVYPWIGIWQGKRFRVDRSHISYISPVTDYALVPQPQVRTR